MSDKQKRHFKKEVKLTPEQQAAAFLLQQQAEQEVKKERERIELYGRNVETMSHRQLRSELVKVIKREHTGRPPQPIPGLTIALGTILLTVLDNTQTSRVFEVDNDGKPTRVARLDQINKLGKLYAYPR